MSMRIRFFGVTVCAYISSLGSPSAAELLHAQDSSEVTRLKQRINLLEAELSRSRKQIARRTAASNPASRSDRTKLDSENHRSLADDATGMRALERTLVREGASLLRAGDVEITPSFSLGIAARSIGRTSNLLEASVSASVGLPSAWQISATLPWSANLSSASSGLQNGDFEFALSKQIVDETRFEPSLVGTVSAGFAAPIERPVGLPGNTGLSSFYGALVATKRLDPLVIYAGFYGRSARESAAAGRDLTWGARFGTFLALTPSITASMGLDFARTSSRNIVGPFASETEGWAGSINFGFSTVLRRNLMMRVNFATRAFGDVPQFTTTVSFPVMF